jgi:hypothetical protein
MTQPLVSIDPRDREILRSLAGRVREIAELPEMAARKERLTRHNGLDPERPLVLCFPEGAWSELLPDSRLECKTLRNWEYALRSKIYWWDHIRDDHVLEPCFDMAWRVKLGDYGVSVPHTHGENRGSYTWEPPIKDLKADFDKLKFRSIEIDREGTRQNMDLADGIFGDLLPLRMQGGYWWSMGLTIDLISLIGLERLMLAMIDEPEELHRLMGWMRDEHLNLVTTLEKEGVLLLNNRNGYTGSGGVAYTTELPQADWKPGSPVRLIDLWGFAESQETVGVSPEMFGEFIFPYQLPILEKFGLNCYGCCEAVHQRLPWIMTIPRLRRVSVSPWADQRRMAEALGRTCIFSRKPNPAQICVSFDEPAIRRDLRETLGIAGKGVLEIIMKDTHTVQQKPERITRWVQLALEEVDRYMHGPS